MINVKEVMKINDKIVFLICDLFEDDIITDKIDTDIGVFEDFEVEVPKNCFSKATTKNIIIRTDKDCSKIKSISFI